MTYRIRDWNKHYENNRTRELKRMDWVPIPNRMDGLGYSTLVDHPNGAAHLGAWLAIVEIASRREERGTLPQEGAGLCGDGLAVALSRISRLPASLFLEVLPRLVEIGWVECFLQDGEIPQEGAGECLRARERVPFPSVPFTSVQGGSGGNGVSIWAGQWKKDDVYARFVADYLGTGAALIDADFEDAYEFAWRRLDFEQKLDRVNALNRHSAEYHADPRFVPKPRKFLETEWERPVRPTASRGAKSETLVDRTMALVKRRIANGEPPI